MLLGIIAAMEEEMNAVKSNMEDVQKVTKGTSVFYTGTCNNVSVVLTQCGVGKVNAAMITQHLIDVFSPSAILNVGSAGACQEGFSFGDVIVASALVQHDFDISAFPGREQGELPELGVYLKTNIDFSNLLVDSVTTAGLKEYLGIIASGDQFVDTKMKKMMLHEQYHALCCEMEGAAIGQVCICNQVPFSVLRGISDILSDESCMDFEVYLKIASENCGKIVSALCENLSRNDSYIFR